VVSSAIPTSFRANQGHFVRPAGGLSASICAVTVNLAPSADRPQPLPAEQPSGSSQQMNQALVFHAVFYWPNVRKAPRKQPFIFRYLLTRGQDNIGAAHSHAERGTRLK